MGAASLLLAPTHSSPRSDAAFSTTAAPSKKYKVGVLGATGAVGQRFVQYLENHPWFEVTALGASERSEGKTYEKAANWQLSADIPAFVRQKTVVSCDPKAMPDVDLVFSALDANVAGDVEQHFRDAGVPVFSNARNYRMVPDVPLVVPPVNGDHLDLVRKQAAFHSGGFIVTNANCSTTGLVIALKPLADAFGIDAAPSAARVPGLPSLDILDNVVPYISGEEEKLESEYKKIMGVYPPGASAVKYAEFPLSAMVNRVHVRDGHSIAVTVKLSKAATPEAVAAVLRAYKPAGGLDKLPSSPASWIEVRDETNRPQPRLDRDTGRGFTTVVGRIRPDPINTVKFFVLSHNTVMGAAGSSILNAELAAVKGLLRHHS